jgi:hypothetical protein
MRNDLLAGKPDDFYFVPLISLSIINFENIDSSINSQAQTLNQQVSKFLEKYVETILLNHYLSSNLKDIFYNQKVVGSFEKGNSYGGSPTSGKPPQAVCFQNYAWETESCAASSFEVSKRLIRSKIENGLLRKITQNEFQDFSGVKISRNETKTFFNDNVTKEEFKRLITQLFPNKSKSM